MSVTDRVLALRDSLKAGFEPIAKAQAGTTVETNAQREFCVENLFPASQPTCAAPAAECANGKDNKCNETLWNFCKDNLWKPAQCGPALAPAD